MMLVFCKKAFGLSNNFNNGMIDENFYIYLKECGFRWNNKDADLYQILLKILKEALP